MWDEGGLSQPTGGPRSFAARKFLGVFLGVTMLAGGGLPARGQELRTVRVKIAADRAIENPIEWRIAIIRLLNDCFRSFEEKLGIKLSVEDVVAWTPRAGRWPLVDHLGELRQKVPPGTSDIVLGVMTPDRTDAIPLGIASYPHAYVLVKNLPAREAMTYALLHELCHIFGAMDIREKGSIMGIEAPGFAIDEFTARAISLNKERSFDRRSFPLPRGALDSAVSLFKRRAEQGLHEPQIFLFLTLLYLEKNELDAASRACAVAAEADPAFPGLHNLMGNICLFRGDNDRAISEYRKALEFQPREAGIHFNLGLAYVQKGMLGEASAEYQAALKIHPGYVEADLALKEIQLAGQDVEAARSAMKPFILRARNSR
jgi:Tfp pilus assembly protein PilF